MFVFIAFYYKLYLSIAYMSLLKESILNLMVLLFLEIF